MFYIFRYLVLFFLLSIISKDNAGQKNFGKQNLETFDYKPYHFGFLLSYNTSSFFLDLKPDFTFQDSLLSVENVPQSGFNLALLASLNFTKNINLRFVPGLSFQDRGLNYRFMNADRTVSAYLKRTESVYIEFPLLLKLRTNRSKNFAAYALMGGKYGLDMQTVKDVSNEVANDIVIKLQDNDYSIDAGGGFDFFLPYFKFCIELKTAFGLKDVLLHEDHQFATPIERLRTRTFVVSFTFEG